MSKRGDSPDDKQKKKGIECVILFTYAGSEESISVVAGETVRSKVLPSTAEDGWIYVMKENGENGFVPATYVEPSDDGLWILGNALYDYEGHLAEGTVSLKKEQIILVNTVTLDKDWVAVRRPECKGGAKGHVPRTHVGLISKPKKLAEEAAAVLIINADAGAGGTAAKRRRCTK